jgi:DNA repair protein RadC
MTQDQEVFLVILLDVQLGVRGISEIARGSRDKVDVPVPDVLRIGIVDGASGMILVHNHPSGAAVHPSDSDKMLTKTLKEACETVHLEMLDHVIVAGDKTYSFAKSGKM